MFHFVYILTDPRTDQPFYVGITNNPNQRFQTHLTDTETNDKKGKWIEQLREEGLEPRMKILEIVESRKEASEREKYWIQEYTQQGIVLTNQVHLECSTSRSKRIVIKGDMSREYLNTSEASERSGLTQVYLTFLLRKGTLKGFRHGHDWLVYTDSLETFLASARKSGPKGPRQSPA